MGFKYCVVFITTPSGEGEKLAELIVEEKLGACVNRVENINSLYRWQGKVERDKEELLIVKTTFDKFKELTKRVKEAHPYSVPEIIALPIAEGNEDYLKWIEESLN